MHTRHNRLCFKNRSARGGEEKGTGFAEDVAERVLESVREEPHHSTAERARRPGVGVGALQAFLFNKRLSKLNARLGFAGYKVEAVRPLQVARLRRIVASRPGSVTHVDYRTFGFLRGTRGEPSIRIGGFVHIDSLTSWATVTLASSPLVLTDSGGASIGDQYRNLGRSPSPCGPLDGLLQQHPVAQRALHDGQPQERGRRNGSGLCWRATRQG